MNSSADWTDESDRVAYESTLSGDLGTLKRSIQKLGDDNFSDIHYAISEAVFERVVEAVPVMLEVLAENVENRIGQKVAYELGEVAYRQKLQQDPRIVPGLLRGYEQLEQMGRLDRLWPVLGAIGECVRYEPKPEAQPVVERSIEYFLRDRSLDEDDSFIFTYMLGPYLVNRGWKKTLALRERFAQEPEPEVLLEKFDNFLEEQTHVEPGYEPGDLTCAAQGEAELAAKQASNLA